MIVDRFVVQVKPGKVDEALALAKEGRKNLWPFYPSRIYTPYFSRMNTIIIENEFKDMVEHDKLIPKVVANEGWGLWIEKWDELIAGPSTREIWNVE